MGQASGSWPLRAALSTRTQKLPPQAEGVCCPAVHRWAAERLYRPETGRGGCGLAATPAGRMSIQRKPLKGGRALPIQDRKEASGGNTTANPIQGHGTDAAPAGQADKRQLLWSLAGASPSEQGDADSVPGFCKCRATGQLQRPKGCKLPKMHLPHGPPYFWGS